MLARCSLKWMLARCSLKWMLARCSCYWTQSDMLPDIPNNGTPTAQGAMGCPGVRGEPLVGLVLSLNSHTNWLTVVP